MRMRRLTGLSLSRTADVEGLRQRALYVIARQALVRYSTLQHDPVMGDLQTSVADPRSETERSFSLVHGLGKNGGIDIRDEAGNLVGDFPFPAIEQRGREGRARSRRAAVARFNVLGTMILGIVQEGFQ